MQFGHSKRVSCLSLHLLGLLSLSTTTGLAATRLDRTSGAKARAPVSMQNPSESPNLLAVLPGNTLDFNAIGATPAPKALSLGETNLVVTIGFTILHQDAFNRLFDRLSAPSSLTDRTYLSPAALQEQFGPPSFVTRGLGTYLTKYGVVNIFPDMAFGITFIAPRHVVESIFAVHIRDYYVPGSRIFYANSDNPRLPAAYARYVSAVLGLNNYARPFRLNRTAPSDLPSDVISPRMIGQSYHFPLEPTDGHGQVVVLVEYGFFYDRDVEYWKFRLHMLVDLVTHLKVITPLPNAALTYPRPEQEVLMDIETVLWLSPDVTVVVYELPNERSGTKAIVSFAQVLTWIAQRGDVSVVSDSWGTCESGSTSSSRKYLNSMVTIAGLEGITVIAGTGDDGALCHGLGLGKSAITTVLPASSPFVTAVGGTTLDTEGQGHYGKESWWSNRFGSGGFGYSKYFDTPAYEQRLSHSARRSVPDVVSDADPKTTFYVCRAGDVCFPAGGTSLSAPTWASAIAIVDQECHKRLGFMNRLLYSLENSQAFHSPATMRYPDNDFAHLGLGSLDLAGLKEKVCSH